MDRVSMPEDATTDAAVDFIISKWMSAFCGTCPQSSLNCDMSCGLFDVSDTTED
jgi:hypothetical protein